MLLRLTAIIFTLLCICLCCSICLRYRGCSSRASLHQLQWRGLPSPAPVQLCVHVEMHCKLPHTHTIKVQTQTNYKHKDRTQTQTTSYAHYQLLSAHTNKHVWHYQLFMFLKTCTNCRGRRVSLPPPVYCGRQAKGQEGYMGPGHGGLGTHTPYKRHRYMEPWHECVDAKKANQEIVTNCCRKAY